MSQYTIIYKYGKRTPQLKSKRQLKIFPQETMAEILAYENEIKKQTELKNKNIADVMNAEKKMTDPWKNGLAICENKNTQRD